MGKKGEKFLFNQNIFDEPGVEEDIVEELPPPPTFSEEELETVRKNAHDKAYSAGKQDGIQSERTSRDQKVAQIIEKIGHDTALLFTAEDKREQMFEAEALRLSLEIFDKLFPHYKEQHGFQELASAITEVLVKQHGQSKILIEVHPDNVEGVLSHIAMLSKFGHDPHKYDIVGVDTIAQDSFIMRWKDGGAICNLGAVADEIKAILHHTLAGMPTNSHDGTNIAEQSAANHDEFSKPEDMPENNSPSDPDKKAAGQYDNTMMENPDER